MANTPAVPVVLCVDVEPDGFFIDATRRDPWAGFEATRAAIEAWRTRLRDEIGAPVHVSWFLRLDAQVARTYGDAAWVLRHYEREFATLLDRGDELGLHPHPYRWDDARGRWILDYATQSWVEDCIAEAVATFATAVGRRCLSFRCGDRFMNQPTADLIARLGIEYDLTLEPGHPEEALPYPAVDAMGRLPDLRGVTRLPFRATTGDYRRPDPAATQGPWSVPITTAAVTGPLLRRVYQAVRYPGRRFDVWSALVSLHPDMFARVVEQALSHGVPHLALPLRTGALVDGRSAPRVTANLEWLASGMRTRGLRVTSPAEAMELVTIAAAGDVPCGATSRAVDREPAGHTAGASSAP